MFAAFKPRHVFYQPSSLAHEVSFKKYSKLISNLVSELLLLVLIFRIEREMIFYNFFIIFFLILLFKKYTKKNKNKKWKLREKI